MTAIAFAHQLGLDYRQFAGERSDSERRLHDRPSHLDGASCSQRQVPLPRSGQKLVERALKRAAVLAKELYRFRRNRIGPITNII